jgi:3-deoxy-D-manno-octulosonic acid kinase
MPQVWVASRQLSDGMDFRVLLRRSCWDCMAVSEIYKRESDALLLVNPCFKGEVTADWFIPEYWGNDATPVASGGRGGAWFINFEDYQLVLREYLRGGLVSHLARRTYNYFGEQRVRSLSEFRVLQRLTSLGLPVPIPVAAWCRKVTPFQYQAAIIIERIQNAVPLADKLEELSKADWQLLGQTIRRFHDFGVRHADLNCFNVLIADGVFFLIDFDKGCIMPSGARSGWKNRNLSRLARSLKKVAGDAELKNVWEVFLNGYKGESGV